MSYNDELLHYGKKGMKWRKRKDIEQDERDKAAFIKGNTLLGKSYQQNKSNFNTGNKNFNRKTRSVEKVLSKYGINGKRVRDLFKNHSSTLF